MKARRDLLGRIADPCSDHRARAPIDAYLPVHPGAAAFYNGTQESFLDKWGNIIFLAPMISGALVSVFGGGLEVLARRNTADREEALDALYALGRRIRSARKQSSTKSSAKSTACFRPSA